jgi:hypothetical protein
MTLRLLARYWWIMLLNADLGHRFEDRLCLPQEVMTGGRIGIRCGQPVLADSPVGKSIFRWAFVSVAVVFHNKNYAFLRQQQVASKLKCDLCCFAMV